MSDLKELIAFATASGMQGDSLAIWLREERAAAREGQARAAEERAAERAVESAREERAAEKERVAEERAADKERAALERAEADKQRQHDLAMEELRKSSRDKEVSHGSSACHTHKLLHFNEQKDDLDAYLYRFEAYATGQTWSRDQWDTISVPYYKGQHCQSTTKCQ